MPDWSRVCAGLLPACLASFAFMTSFLFSFWCESVEIHTINDSSIYENLYFGPWYQRETVYTTGSIGGDPVVWVRNVCVEMDPDPEIDSKWKAVRSFSVIAPVIGGLMTVVLWFSFCFPDRVAGAWPCMALTFILVVTLFQGLTFLLFQTNLCSGQNALVNEIEGRLQIPGRQVYEDDCEWGAGSTSNAFSVALWFLTAVAMLVMGPPKRTPRPPPETQTVTYQQTTNPEDGTTTVAQVAVVKGRAVPKEEPDVGVGDGLGEEQAAD